MYRSQSKSKSLKVRRETIRTLAGAELSAAQGGAGAQRLFFTEDELCPRNPDVQVPNVSLTSPGNGCGPQIPRMTIIVNPVP